ncbi:MAG: hypothetical protein Kow0059_16770 [Candidatus Sumerlaeia bacterium]
MYNKTRFVLYGCMAFLIFTSAATAPGQGVVVSVLEPGYTTGTIVLPENVAGALAPHPANPDLLFVSAGAFGAHHIYKVNVSDLNSPVVTPVVTRDIDSIGGLAVIDDTHLIVTNNTDRTVFPFYSGNPTGLPVETTLLCQDLNTDGDFDDTGEIVELIAPIKISNPDPVFGLFTGSQVRVVPTGGPGALPAGAAVVQTADGATSSELLVIVNPTNQATAAYHPAGDSWFEGFGYNGGLDFYAAVTVAAGAYDGVFALSDADMSGRIDAAGESNLLVGPGDLGFYSLYDLVIDAEGDLFATANDFSAGQIQTLPIPSSPLTAPSTPMTPFAQTNSPFVTAMAISSKARSFDPPATGNDAVLFFEANGPGFSNNPIVFWIAPGPQPPSAVDDWAAY